MFLCISLRSSDFFRNIQKINSKFGGSISIFDEEGRFIFSSSGSQDRDAGEVITPAGKGGVFLIDHNGKKQKINSFIIPRTRWTMVQRIAYDSIFGEISKVRTRVLVYTFVLFLLFITLLVGLLTMFTVPLKKVAKAMLKVQQGDMSQRVRVRSRDEVGLVANTFNSMIEKIELLLLQNQQQQEILRTTELRALQAQINPHFLYNTLDSINWLAKSDGNLRISHMVEALSVFFKISLNHGREKLSVEEELQQVGSYLEIQKIRYQDKFDYFLHIDREIYRYTMIKLILQPLVENSIYHGIKLISGKGTIVITGEMDNAELVFRVTDNGAGMEENILSELNEILRAGCVGQDSDLTYGVKNVNERIQLTYGKQYGVFYSSRKGEYTTAEVRLPAMEI